MTFGKIFAAGVLAASLAMVSSATPVIAGGATVNLVAGTLPAQDVLLDTITGTFSSLYESGTYSTKVYRNTSTNLLDFVYTFSVTAGTDAIKSVTMASFAGFTTDVYYIASGSNVNPATSDRSNTGSTPVKVYYANNATVTQGKTTATVVISTNATQYTAGTFSLQDGSTATVNAFAPCSVPEPMTYSLFGAGLIGIAFLKRKRS